MRKAQGALEYLIIIAAVLAIAAIVVLFLTGAFKGASGGGDIAKCRLAASTCASNVATSVYNSYADCQTACIGACANPGGFDVMNTTIVVNTANCPSTGIWVATGAYACDACVLGSTSLIRG